MSGEPRIVVTGIGLVTPCGSNRETSWQGLLRGIGVARWLDSPHGGVLAGAPAPHISAECESLSGEPVVALAQAAAAEAIADGGLSLPRADRRRIGCVIGTSKGGLRSFASAWRAWRQPVRGPEQSSQIAGLWGLSQPDAAARSVAARYDLGGAMLCPVAACATGLASVIRGVDLIRHGTCDTVLAGSSDASLTMLVQASFRRLRVLAHGFDDPREACRPFDRRRSGFLIGEGAAVLLLEREDLALARGATPYAVWLAGRVASDPAHLTRMDPDSRSLERLIEEVLKEGRLAPDEIDYINLHGTATRHNDVCESRAIKRALGPGAMRAGTSSLKGTIGHLLGAAGSVELAASLLAMRDGRLPPTANLTDPDPECDLDYTPINPRDRRVETVLKLSLGFGGHLAAAALRTWDGPARRRSGFAGPRSGRA
jgi:3-oxoacyl-[acyl-carrier-protein] synthase II